MWETVFTLPVIDWEARSSREFMIGMVILFSVIAIYLLLKQEWIESIIALIMAVICFFAYSILIPNQQYIKNREQAVECAMNDTADQIIEGFGSIDHGVIIIDGNEYDLDEADVNDRIPNGTGLYRVYISNIEGKYEHEEYIVRVDLYVE